MRLDEQAPNNAESPRRRLGKVPDRRTSRDRGHSNTQVPRAPIYLALVLSAGHHLDHVVRGNHIGWPVADPATAFTYSLLVYPLIFLGLYLSSAGKVGAGYWALLSGPGALFLAAIHLGPNAVEPPAEIINQYSTPLIGWLAFTLLLTLIAVLVATFVHETRLWHRHRRSSQPPLQHDERNTHARG